MPDSNPEGFFFIDLSDFSPGIIDDEFADSAADHSMAIPLGRMEEGFGKVAAQVSNTYRCTADQSGALIPLPKATAATQTVTPPGTLTTPTFYPTNQAGLYIRDAMVDGPRWDTLAHGFVQFPPPNDPDEVWALYQFLYAVGGASVYRAFSLGKVFFPYDGATTKEWYFQRDSFQDAVAGTPIGYGFMDKGLHASTSSAPGALVAGPSARIVFVNDFWASITAGGAIGGPEAALTTYDTDVSVNYPSVAMGGTRMSNSNTHAFNAVTGPPAGFVSDTTAAVLHQARLVIAVYPTSAMDMGLDHIYYTLPRTVAQTASPSGPFIFGEENMTGIMAMCSMNAAELFLVRNIGGAVLLRGDIANPTVVRLPQVESTHGIACHPAATPLGVAYLTRRGVYVWNGGDVAERLSPQIDGPFWDYRATPANEPISGPVGRLAWWDDKLLVPNNYLFNAVSGGWWRLDDSANFSSIGWSVYRISPTTGKMYAFPYKITAAATPAWQLFDRTILATSYSWQSQPLVETRRDLVWFEQVEVKAVAASDATVSSITITVQGYDRNGVAGTPATLTISDLQENGRLTFREALLSAAIEARYVTVRIQASSSTGPAPKVLGLRFHCRPGNLVAQG